MRGRFAIYEEPELKEPLLILGFRGWADAGRISSGCVGYLIRKLGARRFGEMIPYDFYILQNSRPLGWIEEGIIRRVEWPSTELFYYKSTDCNDLIFLLADEPNFRPDEYIGAIIDFASLYKVRRIYVIGGVAAPEIPRGEERLVQAVVGDPKLKEELKEYGIGYVTYGSSRQLAPVGIHSLLVLECRKRGIDVISLWGQAPPFASVYPRSICIVLEKLIKILKINVDLEDIKMASEDFKRIVDEIARQALGSERAEQPEYLY